MKTTEAEETSLQDDMKAAISELEGKSGVAEAVEKLEPTKQERSDDGKFKSKEEQVKEEVTEPAKAEPVKAEVTEPVKEEQAPLGGEKILSQDKAPSSWTPAAREEWANLPEKIRQEIIRRDEDSVKGIRQLQDQMAPYTQFAQTLDPFIREAVSNRVDPGQYIGNVMQAERRLRSGTAEERFGSLVEIAESYGIPLRKIINDAVGQEIIPHPVQQRSAVPVEIQQRLDAAEQALAGMQDNQAQSNQKMIDDFKVDKEFFEDVREDMALLMEHGRASTLQDAYDKACKMNPQVFGVIQERGSKPPLADKQKAAALLKSTSSNSAEVGNSDFDDDDDLEATVRKAMAKSAGRI